MGVLIDQHDVAGFVNGLSHAAQHRQPALVRGDLVGGAKAVEVIIEEPFGPLDELLESGTSGGLDEAVRVVWGRNYGHAHRQTGGQETIERADGGLLARFVGIKTEYDLLNVALKNAGMVSGQSRALGRDDVLHAGHEAGDEVKLAFAHDGITSVEQRAFGFVQAEEHFAFGENGRFRRVDVFGGLLIAREDAATETDDPSLLIANGENEPATKPIVIVVAALFAQDEARLFHQGQLVALAFGPVDGVVPKLRGTTKAEQLHRVSGHPAPGQVLAGGLAGGFICQGTLPALGDLLVDLEKSFLEMPRLLAVGAFLVLQWNSRAVSQSAHCFREINAFVRLDESEDVAAFVAAEAMEDLEVGIDVEAWGFFFVKRAKGDEVGAGAFEGQVGPDDIHDVTGGTDLFEGGRRKQARHEIRAKRRTATSSLHHP